MLQVWLGFGVIWIGTLEIGYDIWVSLWRPHLGFYGDIRILDSIYIGFFILVSMYTKFFILVSI